MKENDENEEEGERRRKKKRKWRKWENVSMKVIMSENMYLILSWKWLLINMCNEKYKCVNQLYWLSSMFLIFYCGVLLFDILVYS